jgi:hypothetical protein
VVLAGIVAVARAQDAPMLPPEFSVRVTAAGVSIHAVAAPRASMLDALARLHGIVVVSELPLTGSVSLELTDYAVADAIDRVLAGSSYLLAYVGPHPGPLPQSPNRLHVLAAAGTGSVASARDASREFEAGKPVGDSDPIAAIDALRRRHADDNTLVAALTAVAWNADDPGLREEIAYALAAIAGDQSQAALELMLTDRSETVRQAAADALRDISVAPGDISVAPADRLTSAR